LAEARQRSGSSWLAALLLLATATPAAADDALSRLVGRFHGTAHGESVDRSFIVTLRDVTVELRREGDGFRLAWTTAIADAAGGVSPPTSRRRDTVLHFVPGPGAGTFRTAETAEPFTGRSGGWAVLDDERLVVRVMAIDKMGNWELQTYERTVGGDVMSLHFSRLANGRPEFVVTGRLTRQAD
jgi:hypothetical protein